MTRPTKKPEPFRGFGPKAFSFFRGIDFYQSREWFTGHRALYEEEVLLPMGRLVIELADALRERGLPLTGDPKKALFRIHRDIRFSKDKTPYRTHAGATLSRDGRKLSPGMLYVQVSPGESFLAAGTYHPDASELAALRRAIAHKPKDWLAVVNGLKAAGLELSQEDMLTRLPRGYESFAGSPVADALKRRSLIVRKSLPKASVSSRKLLADILRFGETMRPLLEFQWKAVDDRRE